VKVLTVLCVGSVYRGDNRIMRKGNGATTVKGKAGGVKKLISRYWERGRRWGKRERKWRRKGNEWGPGDAIEEDSYSMVLYEKWKGRKKENGEQ